MPGSKPSEYGDIGSTIMVNQPRQGLPERIKLPDEILHDPEFQRQLKARGFGFLEINGYIVKVYQASSPNS